jgi:hypothetical protein
MLDTDKLDESKLDESRFEHVPPNGHAYASAPALPVFGNRMTARPTKVYGQGACERCGHAKRKTVAAVARRRGAGSGRNGRRRVERGSDIADADDADQAVIVDHRQMPDVVLVHEMTDMFERIARAA